MSYLRGPDRFEVQLLPPCLDDYVAADSPVRFLDVFVEGLKLAELGFNRAIPAATGRPAYHPADLLKLYCYGYLNRIRSSRRLEAEASRNLELMWLLRNLRPDFKTIADFRKDNRQAFKGVLRQFNLLCRSLGLFGAELVAIDGSRFKAVNNSGRYYSQEQLSQLLQQVESRIEEYLKELDARDGQAEGAAGPGNGPQLKEKLQQLKDKKGCYEDLLQQLKLNDQKAVSLTDADCRKMRDSKGYVLGYNVQVAVDAKHDLIVAEQVVQSASDRGQLASMALQAKEQLEVEQLQAVADKGYHEADQLEACEAAAIEAFVPRQGTTAGRGKNGMPVFAKEAFRYEAQGNYYICPSGQKLSATDKTVSRGKDVFQYLNRLACQVCALKSQCSTGSYRVITRRDNEQVVEQAAQRIKDHPEKMAQRRKMVEHVFGTLRLWGHDCFLLRGIEKVRAEFALSALAYNLRRALNVVSVEKLLKGVVA